VPTKIEKDAPSGYETTGHEWDGIRELNRPLPTWWVYVFYATIVFAIVYYILYPAIPGLWGHTEGVLGYSSREAVAEKIAEARAAQSEIRKKIEESSLPQIIADRELFNFSSAGGRSAFADNCAPCHGTGGAGAKGFPSLVDDDWLWGGSLEEIHQTILYGIRADNDETRQNEMPAFGAQGILTAEQISDVADYVLSLSGVGTDAAAAQRGQAIFAEQCTVCHGDNGQGNTELGAPNLTDAIWLYGGAKKDIVTTITNARNGVMPAWVNRLDPATIKMLTVYVYTLGGGQ
jgi:cytochrome c oxidase cbb3-type subunit 3